MLISLNCYIIHGFHNLLCGSFPVLWGKGEICACFQISNALEFVNFLLCILIAVPLIFYGIQHYLSLAGSLVFIPLIMVPTMGGTDVRKFSSVVSTFEHNSKVCSKTGKLILAGGDCYCDFHHAISFWYHDNNAFLLWQQASVGPRKLLCLSGSCFGNH